MVNKAKKFKFEDKYTTKNEQGKIQVSEEAFMLGSLIDNLTKEIIRRWQKL